MGFVLVQIKSNIFNTKSCLNWRKIKLNRTIINLSAIKFSIIYSKLFTYVINKIYWIVQYHHNNIRFPSSQKINIKNRCRNARNLNITASYSYCILYRHYSIGYLLCLYFLEFFIAMCNKMTHVYPYITLSKNTGLALAAPPKIYNYPLEGRLSVQKLTNY